MDEINEELIKQELQKPIGGALLPIEWFVLFTFVDHAMKQDNMFSSQDDLENVSATIKRLHDQIFPKPKEYKEELAEKLAVKPKKIITGPDLIV